MEYVIPIAALMGICVVWGLLSAMDGTGETSRGCGSCAGDGSCGGGSCSSGAH